VSYFELNGHAQYWPCFLGEDYRNRKKARKEWVRSGMPIPGGEGKGDIFNVR
jgi:hypothetical protein